LFYKQVAKTCPRRPPQDQVPPSALFHCLHQQKICVQKEEGRAKQKQSMEFQPAARQCSVGFSPYAFAVLDSAQLSLDTCYAQVLKVNAIVCLLVVLLLFAKRRLAKLTSLTRMRVKLVRILFKNNA
jgi:hypothetical protein